MAETISPEECELIGAYLGDGHIYKRNRKYIIGFTGNPITDAQYFENLSRLIYSAWGRVVKPKFRERAVRIKFDSKPIVERLTTTFRLPFHEGKCAKAKIPAEIEADWESAKHAIRGIVDTDGSVFVADKPGSPKYPSIEITTTSRALAEQLKELLSVAGFNVAKIWAYKSKTSVRTAYKVPLNGKANLRKWISEIGFSNPYKLARAMAATE
ncbi:MAG: LAGLIDADG family homing endonuclease [Candidatus Diapherotrites archaeon]